MTKYKVGDRVVAMHYWAEPYPHIRGSIFAFDEFNLYSIVADDPHFSYESGQVYSTFSDDHLIPEEVYDSPLYKLMQETEETS